MREKENIANTFNALEAIWQDYNIYQINNKTIGENVN